MKKSVVFCVVFMLPSIVMILKLSKKVHFFNFVLTSAKKSKYVKTIQYIYAFERSLYTLLKILVFEIEEFCYISAEPALFLII